jgi:predicted RNA binding protein YcfA (HicA-like mRNA interferase family)
VGLAHGLAHRSRFWLEQAENRLLPKACKAVYTGSIPVGAFRSGKRFLVWQNDLQARCLVRLNPERAPLSHRVVRQSGSHRRMESPSHPPVTFAFHDKATIPGGLVRMILVRDVGLDEEEARKLL